MNNSRLVRVGGIFALVVAVMQIIGNGLHPPIPTNTAEALQLMAATGYWVPIHVLITVSYFMFVPFIIGASAAFQDQNSPLVRIGTVMVVFASGIGAVQIMTHLTLFKYLADQYVATSDATLQQNLILLYEALWPYNVALEIAHLLAIFISAFLFGVAILQDTVFPRWLGWLGIVAGGVASAGILVGKLVIGTRTGDIIFGVGLIPLVIWIIAIGVVLLRLKPAPQPVLKPA
jgi:hypothetical protein